MIMMVFNSRFIRNGLPLLTLLAWVSLLATVVDAQATKAWTVGTGGESLADALSNSQPGDVINLSPGIYGPIVIRKSLKIYGQPGSIIDGKGASKVVLIDAHDVVFKGIEVRGSGQILRTEDSGIYITDKGDRAVVEGNRIIGNLIGVNLKGPLDARVIRNVIVGRKDLRVNERGNGVQLWNTPGSIVADNLISYGRDGIFVMTSKHNRFLRNNLKHVRFGVHYMYTNDSEVSGNRSAGNHLGFAIMFSRNIKVTNNISQGDRDHGILLNSADRSVFKNNVVEGGANKCVFIYNANKNNFLDNHFEGCNIGIHFTAGSKDNNISGNSFIRNRNQVKYIGTRYIEWSHEGKGNFWSDNLSFDLNGDGIGDKPFKPNGIADQILWRHPSAKFLLSSPAMQLLRWTHSSFPAIYPGGVTDSAPLMKPVMQNIIANKEKRMR